MKPAVSFPRKREPSFVAAVELDPRLRGDDTLGGFISAPARRQQRQTLVQALDRVAQRAHLTRESFGLAAADQHRVLGHQVVGGAARQAIGAVGGGAPAPGLDLGNSPSQVAALDLRGRRVIQFTAGGMHALAACGRARMLLAASLVNATATAAYLQRLWPAAVTLVTTGAWVDRDGDEDHACADLIADLLAGRNPPRAPFAARVRNSDFGRRFAADTDPHLPRADLDCCAQVDRFDFAMPLNRLHDGFAMRPVPAAGGGGGRRGRRAFSAARSA